MDGDGASVFEGEAEAVRPGLVLACFGLSGFLYVGYELLWMRTFLLFFRDSIYLYVSCLAAVIAGVAVGSFTAGRLADRVRSRRMFLGWLFGASALLHTAFLLGVVRLHRPLCAAGVSLSGVGNGVYFLRAGTGFCCSGGNFSRGGPTARASRVRYGRRRRASLRRQHPRQYRGSASDAFLFVARPGAGWNHVAFSGSAG